MADNLERSLQHLAWWHLAGAVLDTFEANQQSEDVTGIKASADTWGIADCLRLSNWQTARRFWAHRTGLIDECFPYSVDCVARLYFRFRKRNADEIAEFRREIATAEMT